MRRSPRAPGWAIAERQAGRRTNGEALRTFAIITTAANREMSELHDRMPLVLEEPDWRLWLGEDADDAAELLRLAPDGTLRAWPVRCESTALGTTTLA